MHHMRLGQPIHRLYRFLVVVGYIAHISHDSNDLVGRRILQLQGAKVLPDRVLAFEEPLREGFVHHRDRCVACVELDSSWVRLFCEDNFAVTFRF